MSTHSYAMNLLLKEIPSMNGCLTQKPPSHSPHYDSYRVLGGVLDFYVFAGPSPEDVLRQYHAVIGKPAMPPLWALGLHQSRWGPVTLFPFVCWLRC